MEDTYFSISDLLKTIESKKTIRDFKKTDIYENLLEIDTQSIIGDRCKNKYYRTVLYWAEPTLLLYPLYNLHLYIVKHYKTQKLQVQQ